MSDCDSTKRVGLQVVKLSETPGQRYEVNEKALASVLLRQDVRHLPVVVVSVAGAYRGGKSFILDFFLRYLTASRESQLTSEWLGNESELLEGFDWRGGGEANTKGIHLWPEPIIVDIEKTREKVAVLLMDTQGTFDTDIDMDENSTIFALSTLLSSVQIYNIRANIGEDDLQHLQLFTEYGRLVSGEEQKAFQTLNFLVRDWMSPYEHPYGYMGGKTLLNKKLQTNKPNQKKQLQEVRQHIHSCFEKLECFLMPHPGLAVADPNFRGRLSDITKDFRTSLLELVPSLFHPDNLTPKIINGDKVQAQGLLEYFKQYVNIFNSDDLPEAVTIFKATADACMMAALRESRHVYESKMESNMIDGESVTTRMLQHWHEEAVSDALEHFKCKKKLGSQENVDKYLEDFKKELEARLSLFLWQNDAQVRTTLSQAKKTYDAVLALDGQVCLCLHPSDLQKLHQQALEAALQKFQMSRTRVPQEEDDEKTGLIENLEKHYKHLYDVNEQNNKNAIIEAREVYIARMRGDINQVGVSTEILNTQHETALAEAIKHFNLQRNSQTEELEDPFMEQLKQDIATYYKEFQESNVNSNQRAIQIAVYTYNNFIDWAWGPSCFCFHPRGLEKLHEDGRKSALEQFLKERVESENDEFKEELIEILETRYKQLQKINNFINDDNVSRAFNEYTLLMDKYTHPAILSIFVVPFIMKVGALPRHHDNSKRKAISIFVDRRRGRTYDDDEYMEKLKQKINAAFENYKSPMQALTRELGINQIMPGTI